MKLLILDNYDSFAYNLVHIIKGFGYTQIDVFRNNKITLAEVNKYDKIILSPGPGIPSEAGILLPLIQEYAAKKPILGVCLGHQAIGEVFGAKLANLKDVFHGIASMATLVNSDYLFQGIESPLTIGRYHSWIVSDEMFPECLEITATDENGQIMALRHKEFDVHGVQFHPESVLTPEGSIIIKNFIMR